MLTDSQVTSSSLCSPGSQRREWCYPQWAGLTTSSHLIKVILYSHAQRFISLANLDLIQLMVEINLDVA